MKNKTAAVILLCIAFIFQLMIPVSLIIEKETIKTYGTEYKLLISSISYEDKNTLEIYYHGEHNLNTDDKYRYVTLTNINEDLWAFEKSYTETPDTYSYLRSSSIKKFEIPVRYYQLNNKSAEVITDNAATVQNANRYFYSTIKILNGKCVLTGIFLDDGSPIELLA